MNRRLPAAAALLLCAVLAPAANRYVRADAAGAASGANWTDAWSDLPAALVRGDTYYVADGVYGGLTLDDPENGSLAITIRKATAADHGTGAGWNAAYGDGQAVFSGFSTITADRYLLDGQGRGADWRSGYGFRLTAPGDQMTVRLDDASGANTMASGSHYLTFRFVEFDGASFSTADGLYSLGRNSHITIQYCYLHDYGRTHVLSRSWDTVLVEHTYFARNQSSEALHGESWSDLDTNNFIYRYNVTEDCEGTAIIFTRIDTASNWEVYGNLFWWTPVYAGEGISGLIISDSSVNWKVYNNTIYRAPGLYSGLRLGDANIDVWAYNNLWWDCVLTGNQGALFDYNFYFQTREDYPGPHDVLWSGQPLFADPAAGDFHLRQGTAPGLALPAPYGRDLEDNLRGADGAWDRGALEYRRENGQADPSTPRNLRVLN